MATKQHIHVLVIPSWLPTRDNPFGGIFILDQARAIQRHTATNVGFIYRQDFTLSKKHDMLPGSLEGFKHVVVTKPYTPKANATTIKLWCRQYYEAYRDYTKMYGTPDIIHAHSYIAGFAARYISEKNGVPFILTEHLTAFVSDKIKTAHISCVRKVLSEASGIIAVSILLREALAKYTTRDIEVIPNLYNEDIFTASSSSPNPHFTISSVGDLIPRKGFDLLIEVFRIAHGQDHDLRLEIIGTGALRGDLEKQVRGSNLTSLVTFHGGASTKDVAAIFQASDVCISTSHTETFGITLIEAMGCGIPVIATSSGGPQEIITPQTGIRLEDRDPASIAQAILDVKRNRDAYSSSFISEYAKRNFGSAAVSGMIYSQYCEITLG